MLPFTGDDQFDDACLVYDHAAHEHLAVVNGEHGLRRPIGLMRDGEQVDQEYNHPLHTFWRVLYPDPIPAR
ncbi:hypothetical protein KSS95_21565 [Pseudomonas muyukensis]|uniref:Uncharacterized protein n=1 Tax=Pseudomonas muyukensis TaxID=2842357 RepID=A0ABX8M6S4_9PSED|nr:hypothetical protein [Pseudomonas muyukensis]QXH34698.1 hypothetical protein KSS95_21565 [Pseudomonas muyukensis]